MIVQHFEKNILGRDFIIGDIHGCLEEFNKVLEHLAFDKNVDRMFSVGDLVDRGPNSVGCLALLDEEWFHAVIGNHEVLFYDAVASWDDNDNTPIYKKSYTLNTWMSNGGYWIEDRNQMRGMTNAKLQHILDNVKNLPNIIRISGYEKTVNITHAELYSNVVDLNEELIENLNQMELDAQNNYDVFEILSSIKQQCCWGRRVVKNATNESKTEIEDLTLLDQIVVCGHSVVTQPSIYKNHIFIDGGACFKPDNYGFVPKFMVYNIQKQEIEVIPIIANTITEHNNCW